MAQNTVTITDYSDENSSFGFSSAALTSGNIVAQTGLLGDLATATEAISIGHLSKQQVAQILVTDPDIPTNPYAQREMKWLVTYADATSGKKYSLEIPAPDITDNVVPNTDQANLTSTDWAAWVDAFEAVAKAPEDLTHSVTVIGAVLVGRNI